MQKSTLQTDNPHWTSCHVMSRDRYIHYISIQKWRAVNYPIELARHCLSFCSVGIMPLTPCWARRFRRNSRHLPATSTQCSRATLTPFSRGSHWAGRRWGAGNEGKGKTERVHSLSTSGEDEGIIITIGQHETIAALQLHMHRRGRAGVSLCAERCLVCNLWRFAWGARFSQLCHEMLHAVLYGTRFSSDSGGLKGPKYIATKSTASPCAVLSSK